MSAWQVRIIGAAANVITKQQTEDYEQKGRINLIILTNCQKSKLDRERERDRAVPKIEKGIKKRLKRLKWAQGTEPIMLMVNKLRTFHVGIKISKKKKNNNTTQREWKKSKLIAT